MAARERLSEPKAKGRLAVGETKRTKCLCAKLACVEHAGLAELRSRCAKTLIHFGNLDSFAQLIVYTMQATQDQKLFKYLFVAPCESSSTEKPCPP